MWLAPQHGIFSAAGCSPISNSPRARAWCCSRSQTMRTRTGSRIHHRRRSHSKPGCSDLASGRRSRCFTTARSSRSSRRVALGSQPDIGSRSTASYGLRGGLYLGVSYGLLGMQYRPDRYGPPRSHEVDISHVGCSSELQSSHTCITRSGQLAARCPSGEEAQGEVTSGVGHGLARSRSRWLMRGESSGCARDRAGRLSRDGLTGWRSKATTDAGHLPVDLTCEVTVAGNPGRGPIWQIRPMVSAQSGRSHRSDCPVKDHGIEEQQ